MIEVKAEIKKWGNSLAIILPKEQMKDQNMKIGKKLTIMIPENDVSLRDEFGSLKSVLKKSTTKIMREIDEGWN